MRWACDWDLLVHQWFVRPAWQVVQNDLKIWAWAWWSVPLKTKYQYWQNKLFLQIHYFILNEHFIGTIW
jgi:hypothetical protein